ncbi:GNAT family N-acetyltransferase [Microvirga sp. CF3016]|uniref:GNAT family N-acetyltransferase n=1 Tax=Microvirga sp. CF3016 TaxID=3110181 RepID=UPI002E79D15C|nr:GNAT family N-acetyltransferase [Microvirga sp. CF3016]MEE1610760.1 GNAT family N-acetyltransferase [Microvirga sp. CF3016]
MLPCPEEIRTERLILRRWTEDDVARYAALQADPEVRRFFPGTMPIEKGEADARLHAEGFERHGFDQWVVELPGISAFIGVAGLRRILREMPFQPRVDVGWHFVPAYWGRGYATEAARAALRDIFERSDLQEVVAYTSRMNEPSRKVMHRLGMTHDPAEDFDHPAVPDHHPLRRHVLYRISRQAFSASNAS